MSQPVFEPELPVTSYALLGMLTFGDELTAYEIKQRADATLRFYWTSPATSQVYSELARLAEHGLVAPRTQPEGARDVTTYAISDVGRTALRAWMSDAPAGFPVLKHPVLLRLLIAHAGDPEGIRVMLEDYLAELDRTRTELTEIREALHGVDAPGDPFHHPSMVADWGLEYFETERRNAERTLARLSAEG